MVLKDKSLISIIIPVFNQLTYTKECLDHIYKYTNIPYELIIIDNGSSDGTGEFLKIGSATVISNKTNKGVYIAWNQGIQASQSDQIVIMNNDILVTPHWASSLLQFSNTHPRLVIGPAMREGALNYPLIEYSEKFTRACLHAFRMNELCNFSLVLIKRSYFDEVGLFDEQYFVTRGDDDMLIRLREKGIRTAVTGSAFVHHYSEKTQTAQTSLFDIQVIRKKDDDLFHNKWRDLHEEGFYRKKYNKVSDHLKPLYEKLRYGYSLKTPKAKNDRLINKRVN
jgi:GT2 family glycosyltransferase